MLHPARQLNGALPSGFCRGTAAGQDNSLTWKRDRRDEYKVHIGTFPFTIDFDLADKKNSEYVLFAQPSRKYHFARTRNNSQYNTHTQFPPIERMLHRTNLKK